MEMRVRTIIQIAMPTLMLRTGCAVPGLATLAKIAKPSAPNTDQIARKQNTPPQMAPQSVRPLAGTASTARYERSAIISSSAWLDGAAVQGRCPISLNDITEQATEGAGRNVYRQTI